MIEQNVSLASNGVVKVPGYEQMARFGYTKNRGVYRLAVTASGEWEGLTIRAFWHTSDGKDPASSLVVDGYVDVPASVTAQPGNGCITFEGSDGTKTVTSADLRYRVSANSGTEDGTEPEPGTPAWQQLVDAVHTDATAAEQAKTDAQTAAQQAGASAQKAGQALSDTITAKENALKSIGDKQTTATQAVDAARDKAVEQVNAATEAAQTAANEAAASAGNASHSAQEAANSLQELKDGIASGDFKGEKGDKGDTGPIGPVGPQGEKGDTGPAVAVDFTLSIEGKAADAKATGDAVGALKEDLSDISKEVNGYVHDVPAKYYKITFNEVWRSDTGTLSPSAAVSEVCLLDVEGIEQTIASATADSEYSTDYSASKTIDGDLATMWSSKDATGVVHELILVLDNPAIIKQLGIVPRANIEFGVPNNMTIYASVDGVEWVEVAHFEDQKDSWAEREWEYFSLNPIEDSLQSVRTELEIMKTDISGVKYIPVNTVSPEGIWDYHGLPVTDQPKTVTFVDDSNSPFYGYTPYLISGGNLLPNVNKFNQTSPVNGISLSQKGRLVHISGITATRAQFYYMNGSTYNFPLPDSLKAGDTFNIRSFASGNVLKAINLIFFWKDANGNGIGSKNHYINSIDKVTSITIPSGTAWFQLAWDITSTDQTSPHDTYIVVAMYKKAVNIRSDNQAPGSSTDVSAIPIPFSGIFYNASVKDYIDIQSERSEESLSFENLGYITPEMYGAYGDDYNDDTTAIHQCLDYGAVNGIPVKMQKAYITSSPIVIGSRADVSISKLTYLGNDSAVILDGNNSKLEIRQLKSSGKGLTLLGKANRVYANEITIGSVVSSSHCVTLECTMKSIFGNRITFMQLHAGGDGCYCITDAFIDSASYTTENTFMGGQCENADWAFYGSGGNNKFYNIQVEGDIKGGFHFIHNANALIVGDRHAESQRDGEYPYLKISTPQGIHTNDGAAVTSLVYISPISLKVNEIDVSEVDTEQTNDDGYVTALTASSGMFGRINCGISGYGITGLDDSKHSQCFGTSAFIWGNTIIFQGVPYKYYTVKENLDLRTIDEDTPAMPSVFEIGCENCEIRLHPTYCCFGIQKFEVIQTDTYKAKIYDYFTDSLVFDGDQCGAGVFEVNTYLNADFARINGEGMAWRVRKIN